MSWLGPLIKVLNKNLNNLNITDKSIVLNKDYNDALCDLKNNKFDIIFLDPPYKDEILNDVISTIIKYDLLNKEGIIVKCLENAILLKNVKPQCKGLMPASSWLNGLRLKKGDRLGE